MSSHTRTLFSYPPKLLRINDYAEVGQGMTAGYTPGGGGDGADKNTTA